MAGLSRTPSPCVRCGGRCCAVFWIAKTPSDWAAYDWSGEGYEEQRTIAAMVVPLSTDEMLARLLRFQPGDCVLRWLTMKSGAAYTCRHWNEATRRCDDHENRPWMCRGYPYIGNHCERGYRLSRADAKAYRAYCATTRP